MLSISDIKKYLQENLKESRYIHTLGVVETAKELARLNGASIEKAEIAALIHDVAKNMPKDIMLKIFEDNNIKLTSSEEKTKELWHSILSPIVAKEKLSVYDEEILEAARWHSTGKVNMSILEKIIYIADMIEPGRNFPGIDSLRELTFKDLDKGVLAGLNHTINYLSSKGLPVDKNTLEARDYLIKN